MVINAKEARASVNARFRSEVNPYLESVFKAIQSATTYLVTIKAPSSPYVMLEAIKELEALGYEVTNDKYSDQRESWNNLVIKF